MAIKFIDHHPHYASSVFHGVTNEEPEQHNALLGDNTYGRIASICSGGEIPLFCLNHRAPEVVAIDHSYSSLTVCFLKLLALQKFGPQVFHHAITRPVQSSWAPRPEEWKELRTLMDQVLDQLPTPLTPNLAQAWQNIAYAYEHMRQEWSRVGLADVERAYAHLDRLTIVHGDLNDLKEFGQFDLIYLSNALEHFNRTGNKLQLNEEEFLKPGGHILLTKYTSVAPKASWTHLNTRRGMRSTWHHILYATKDAADAESKVA